MDNIIQVSQQFKDLTKDETNKYNHVFRIYNQTKNNFEITEYINPESFRILLEKESLNAKANSNEVNITINIHRSSVEDISTIINKGDVIIIEDTFNNETIKIFTGFVDYNIPKTYDNSKKQFNIKIFDRLKDGVKAMFDEEEVWVDFWLCNSLDTQNSLAHNLAYKMGFTDYEIDFEDITDEAGQPLIGKYRVFKKDTKVFDELRLLVEAVLGSIFVNNEGKLTLTTPFNERDFDDIGYSFEKENVLGKIDEKDIPAEYNGVEVKYLTFELQPRQVIWQYMNQENYDSDRDLAKMQLRAGQKSAWIEFKYINESVCLEIEREGIETLFEDSAGKEININYEVKYNQVGGRVQFINPYNYDVIIQRFKIFGKPLTVYTENKINYSDIMNPNSVFTYDNPYIQSEIIALLNARHNFRLRCNDKKKYTLISPILPNLSLLNRVDLNTIDITDKAIVERIEHDIEQRNSKLEMISFVPYDFPTPIIQKSISRTPNLQKIIDDVKFRQVTIDLKEQINAFSEDNLITKIEALGLKNNYESLKARTQPVIDRARELGVGYKRTTLEHNLDLLGDNLESFTGEGVVYPVKIEEDTRIVIASNFSVNETKLRELQREIRDVESRLSEQKAEEKIEKLSKANRAIQPTGSILFHLEDSLTSTTGEIAEIVNSID